MSIHWNKRLVTIAALTTSLSGVGVASAQSWAARDVSDNYQDLYVQRDSQDRSENRGGEKIETVGYGRDHGRHDGWYKRRHNHNKRHNHGHRHGRNHGHDRNHAPATAAVTKPPPSRARRARLSPSP